MKGWKYASGATSSEGDEMGRRLQEEPLFEIIYEISKILTKPPKMQ